MNPSDYRVKSRRQSYDYDDQDSGLRLCRKSGVPMLYVLFICANIVGMICLGIITDYWAKIENPTCFLYAQSASHSNVYTFGSSLTNCYWVTYGALPSTIIGLVCGIYFMVGVFGDPLDQSEESDMRRNLGIILGLMLLASLIQLAVCCTLAEGMRITCTNMGLNAVNGKADNCMDKLDLRVAQYTLPVDSSTMINAGSAGLWIGMSASVMLIICHFLAFFRSY